MNRNQLLQKCQEKLAAQRAHAQNAAYKNLLKARKNAAFLQNEKDERTVVFEIGKLDAFGAPYTELTKKLNGLRRQRTAILNSIGLTDEDLRPQYYCKVCEDLGFKGATMCSCLKNMLNEALLKESGAGKDNLADFKDFNPDVTANPEHKEILLKLKKKFEMIINDYPDTFPKFIFLSGKTGVGKTFISECLAKALIDKGYLVSFVSAFGMNNIFLSYHTSFDDQKQGYMSSLIDPDILVIDDLGTEPNFKNVTTPYLYVLLSERSRLNKLTVVTSNLEPLQIIDKYNERIFSRLCNKKESFIAQIKGSDLRIHK